MSAVVEEPVVVRLRQDIAIMPVPALLTLYLATVVETSAHNKLYEHFPQWYSDVSEENLPTCVRDREIRRRLTSGGGGMVATMK